MNEINKKITLIANVIEGLDLTEDEEYTINRLIHNESLGTIKHLYSVLKKAKDYEARTK